MTNAERIHTTEGYRCGQHHTATDEASQLRGISKWISSGHVAMTDLQTMSVVYVSPSGDRVVSHENLYAA